VTTSIAEDPSRVLRAMHALHKNICITGFGQLDDLDQRIEQQIDEEQDVIKKYTFKSSYYTFVNPLQVGLILGGVSDEGVLEEIERIGVPAGVAFQLHDDVLGVFGETAQSGKSNQDDIKEGKYTLLLHHALQHGDAQDVRLLRETVGNASITDEAFRRIQSVLEKTGSRIFVESEARRYAERAKAELTASAFWDEDTKKALTALVDYSIEREA
jgi:geranylgeranyl pyrophosphate synthase